MKECKALVSGAAASGGPRTQLLHDIDWPVRGAAAIRVGDYKLIRLPAEAGGFLTSGTRLTLTLLLLLLRASSVSMRNRPEGTVRHAGTSNLSAI